MRFGARALEAGIPGGVFNVVTGFGGEAGAALVGHPLLRGVSFTVQVKNVALRIGGRTG